jgi:hypothetical protein
MDAQHETALKYYRIRELNKLNSLFNGLFKTAKIRKILQVHDNQNLEKPFSIADYKF